MMSVSDLVFYMLRNYDFSVVSSSNLKIVLFSYLTLLQNLDLHDQRLSDFHLWE